MPTVSISHKISGIYTITNNVNSKMYVGYASHIPGRLSTHRKELNRNKHKNPHLQESWNFYGEDNFKFEELVRCEKEHLASEEHYWATLLNVHDRKYGYNDRPTNPLDKPGRSKSSIQKGAKSLRLRFANDPEMVKRALEKLNKMSPLEKASRKVWSDAERKAMSERIKKQRTAHINNRACWNKRMLSLPKVPVLQYDLSGKFIREFERMKTAATETTILEQSISACCRHYKNITTAGGFIWKYKTDNYPLQLSDTERHISSVDQFDSNRNYIATYHSITEVVRIFDIKRNYLSTKMRENKIAKGYYFKFKTPILCKM